MADDDILKALGRLAREHRAADALADAVHPLDEAIKQRMAERAVEALQGTQPLATVTALAPRKKRWPAAAIAGPMALAASLAVWVAVRAGPETLPRYEMSLSGGLQALRAAPVEDAPLVLGAEAQLTLVLRPATAVEQPVTAKLFVKQNTRTREWRSVAEVSSQGAVKLTANAADLGPMEPGELELVVVVGRPDALPAETALERTSGAQQFRRKASWR